MLKLFEIFFVFFKVGAFTIGGGQAMIPILERELVINLKWISTETFLEVLSIAEITPGPIAVNAATFIGYKLNGILGSAVATLGVTLPSFIVIYTISLFFTKDFREKPIIKSFMSGILPVVLALIVIADYVIIKKAFTNPIYYIMAIIIFIFISKTKLNLALILLISGVVGMIIL